MTAKELKKKYLDFFVKKGHKIVPNASLIPENDPTALFINSGMHPLVPYLLGEDHPLGKRLCSLQRCVRTGDIEEVGDTFHHTFFEMLGNWSLGDYWKKEALSWSWEFLTKELNLEQKRIYVTCFSGDKDLPKDEEAAGIWRSLGVPRSRISFLGIDVNWWAVGKTGPCGPSSEMYYDTGRKPCSEKCQPGCDCDKYIEIWNDVFMAFNRKADGKLEKLKQQNIDTGMGFERTTAVLQGTPDNYQTELFTPIIRRIENLSGKKYPGLQLAFGESPSMKTHDRELARKDLVAFRTIADHLRAAVFMIADGILPSNVEQGYVLRRLIRRAVMSGRQLEIKDKFTFEIARVVLNEYEESYPYLQEKGKAVRKELRLEEERFSKALDKGIGALKKIFRRVIGGVDPENLPKGMIIEDNVMRIDGREIFRLYETYGLPPELCQEIMTGWGVKFDDKTVKACNEAFDEAFKKHQEKSRASLEKKFAGGLADDSEVVTKFHTATHLLHQALREVLGEHVQQVGSNITAERLRFDFTHPEKLTEVEIKQIEEIVNKQIKVDLPVKVEAMTLDEAKKKGALAFFTEKYGDKVKVYFLGDYSCEVCGGPHVASTGEIGGVKIIKEKPVGTGRRRIYASLA